MIASKPPLQAVLFDFGGVITNDPFRQMPRSAVEHGFDLAEFAYIAVGMGDYGAGDHPWHRLERGEIDLEEYTHATTLLAQARGHAGFPELPVDMILNSALDLRPEMMDLLVELRERDVVTGIVTNNIRALGAWRNRADWDSLVDIIVDSCEVGMRKPEARMYHHVCGALDVDPAATLFLDDMLANVDGAIAVGMLGLLVTDPAAAVAEVRRLVG